MLTHPTLDQMHSMGLAAWQLSGATLPTRALLASSAGTSGLGSCPGFSETPVPLL